MDIVGCVRLSFKLRAFSFKLRAFSFKLRAFSLCEFIVSVFCTKTRLFNLRRNKGSHFTAFSFFLFIVTSVTIIALE